MSRLVLTRTQTFLACALDEQLHCMQGCSHAFSALRAHKHTHVTAVSHTPEGKLCSTPLFLQIYLQTPARTQAHALQKVEIKGWLVNTKAQSHKTAPDIRLVNGTALAFDHTQGSSLLPDARPRQHSQFPVYQRETRFPPLRSLFGVSRCRSEGETFSNVQNFKHTHACRR